jgi:hypothetical protein
LEFNKNEHPVQYNEIENLVDWSRWMSNGVKADYERSWEELIRPNEVYRTESCHPNAEATLMWAEKIFNFINDY